MPIRMAAKNFFLRRILRNHISFGADKNGAFSVYDIIRKENCVAAFTDFHKVVYL